jgi:hypothetical protein
VNSLESLTFGPPGYILRTLWCEPVTPVTWRDLDIVNRPGVPNAHNGSPANRYLRPSPSANAHEASGADGESV